MVYFGHGLSRSVMSRRSHCFLGINQYFRELMCLAQAHNTVILVRIEPRTSRFGVRRSTTRSPCSSHLKQSVTSYDLHFVKHSTQTVKRFAYMRQTSDFQNQVHFNYVLLFNLLQEKRVVTQLYRTLIGIL